MDQKDQQALMPQAEAEGTKTEILKLEGDAAGVKMPLYKKILIAAAAIIIAIMAIQAINASKYKMMVKVKDGENIMGINPLGDNLDFGDLSRGNGMTRYVSLKSAGNIPTYIGVIKFGELSDLVKADKSFFVLNGGEEAKIAFEINIPVSAGTRQYSGWVWIFRVPKFL